MVVLAIKVMREKTHIVQLWELFRQAIGRRLAEHAAAIVSRVQTDQP
jgi:hypothetical protein